VKRVVEHVKPKEPIPEDTILAATIVAIREIKKDFKDGTGEQPRIEFKFKITAPGVWEGQTITGDLPDNLNDGEFNRFRQWCELLLGFEIPLGYELDTDDLINKACRIVVGARNYINKNGEPDTWNSVEDLLQADEEF
jgi:hypothetical protein